LIILYDSICLVFRFTFGIFFTNRETTNYWRDYQNFSRK